MEYQAVLEKRKRTLFNQNALTETVQRHIQEGAVRKGGQLINPMGLPARTYENLSPAETMLMSTMLPWRRTNAEERYKRNKANVNKAEDDLTRMRSQTKMDETKKEVDMHRDTLFPATNKRKHPQVAA
jgi:hypothetical protein